MGHKEYCVVSGVVCSLVALAHLLRMVYGMSAQIDEYAVPMSVSWVAFIVTAALAVWAFRRGSISRRLEALINDRINRRKSAWKH